MILERRFVCEEEDDEEYDDEVLVLRLLLRGTSVLPSNSTSCAVDDPRLLKTSGTGIQEFVRLREEKRRRGKRGVWKR